MVTPWLMFVRFNAVGAAEAVASGMTAYAEMMAERIGTAPGKGKVLACYGSDDHEWDLVVLGESEDLPAYWAAMQLRARPSDRYADTKLIPLCPLAEMDRYLTPSGS
ncbi:MAG: hypothetical protein AB7W59_08725 [Acidimicrobiia bacterium]